MSVLEKIKKDSEILKELKNNDNKLIDIAEKIEENKEKKEKEKDKDFEELFKQLASEELQIILKWLHKEFIVPDEDYMFFSVFDEYRKIFKESKLYLVLAETLSELEEKIENKIALYSEASAVYIHTIEKNILSELKFLNKRFADLYNDGRIGTFLSGTKHEIIEKSREHLTIPIDYKKLKYFWEDNHNYEYGFNKYFTFFTIPTYGIRYLRILEVKED